MSGRFVLFRGESRNPAERISRSKKFQNRVVFLTSVRKFRKIPKLQVVGKWEERGFFVACLTNGWFYLLLYV